MCKDDDETTPNGKVTFKIKSGNELGLFKLQLGNDFCNIVPARSLKGFYGNYTLSIDAMDLGKPQNVVTKDFNICIQGMLNSNVKFKSLC